MNDFYYTSIRDRGVATEYYVQSLDEYNKIGSHMLRTIALLLERTGEFTKPSQWKKYNEKCIQKSIFHQFQNRYTWAASCQCLWSQLMAQFHSTRGNNKTAWFSKPQIIGFNATLDRVDKWFTNYLPAKKFVVGDLHVNMVNEETAKKTTTVNKLFEFK